MSENEPKDDTTAEAGTDEGRPISNRLLGDVCKTLLDGAIMVCLGFPVAVVAYLWQHVEAGWALGEWLFDKDAFLRRYSTAKRVEINVK